MTARDYNFRCAKWNPVVTRGRFIQEAEVISWLTMCWIAMYCPNSSAGYNVSRKAAQERVIYYNFCQWWPSVQLIDCKLTHRCRGTWNWDIRLGEQLSLCVSQVEAFLESLVSTRLMLHGRGAQGSKAASAKWFAGSTPVQTIILLIVS